MLHIAVKTIYHLKYCPTIFSLTIPVLLQDSRGGAFEISYHPLQASMELSYRSNKQLQMLNTKHALGL